MKVWVIIKPWDYSIADVEIFSSQMKAQKAKDEAVIEGSTNTSYRIIARVDVQ